MIRSNRYGCESIERIDIFYHNKTTVVLFFVSGFFFSQLRRTSFDWSTTKTRLKSLLTNVEVGLKKSLDRKLYTFLTALKVFSLVLKFKVKQSEGLV